MMAKTRRTLCMNLRHTGRISLLKVAENIMTCLLWGVARKIFWTSRRMSNITTTFTTHKLEHMKKRMRERERERERER